MSFKKTMKLGFIGFICTPPKTVTDPEAIIAWQVNKAAELDCQVFHCNPGFSDQAGMERTKALIDAKGIELELGAAGTFGLVGPDAAASRKLFEKSIEQAKFYGSKIIRCGYGRLNVATTRWNRNFPIKEHMQLLVDNLKEAAKILEGTDLLLAIENHCDFKGKEFVEIFDAVGSTSVGAALDTANGFTVFCDPNEDVEVLAPYAITTHIKDMRVWDYDTSDRLIRMLPFGCAVGEGNVDVPRAIDLLDKLSPHADGLHLIIEQGWSTYFENIPFDQQDKEMLYRGLKYIRGVLNA